MKAVLWAPLCFFTQHVEFIKPVPAYSPPEFSQAARAEIRCSS